MHWHVHFISILVDTTSAAQALFVRTFPQPSLRVPPFSKCLWHLLSVGNGAGLRGAAEPIVLLTLVRCPKASIVPEAVVGHLGLFLFLLFLLLQVMHQDRDHLWHRREGPRHCLLDERVRLARCILRVKVIRPVEVKHELGKRQILESRLLTARQHAVAEAHVACAIGQEILGLHLWLRTLHRNPGCGVQGTSILVLVEVREILRNAHAQHLAAELNALAKIEVQVLFLAFLVIHTSSTRMCCSLGRYL
mmetsp:Transcript_2286/g.3927  ORF Transcript_2286/g.3927 Transcript_2286/m.3927 type:complete len:249 (+) Transcript_2286:482-1228(+)